MQFPFDSFKVVQNVTSRGSWKHPSVLVELGWTKTQQAFKQCGEKKSLSSQEILNAMTQVGISAHCHTWPENQACAFSEPLF